MNSWEEAAGDDLSARMGSAQIEGNDSQDDDAAEENDPLWRAVFQLAGGDREKTERMLEDPDGLMQCPEVRRAMQLEEQPDPAISSRPPPAPVPTSRVSSPAPVEASSRRGLSTVNSPVGSKGDDEDDKQEGGEIQEEDPREHLNLVLIGHVDAGKSTMSGQLLYLTGQVDKRTIDRFEKEAKQLNRESWFLAFIMDTNEEERAKGKTVEVGRAHFETDVKRYTILDAPGHKNYVPNMIAGAVQADVGILVISARRGEFETGFERGGQTREHALLAKTLGVRYLVVVINKMDDTTVQWSKERFDDCVTKLKPFLKSCGFAPKKDVKFVPVSGLTGDNLLQPVATSTCPWWEELYRVGEHNTGESTLVGCLDALHMEGRDPHAPLRMPILDRYYDRGSLALGKVETGMIKVGTKVTIMPTNNAYEVQIILINDLPVRTAKPGENVKVKLAGANMEDLHKGYVICPRNQPCHAARRFECQLALVDLLDHRPIFSSGYTSVLHLHTSEEECTVHELLSMEDKKTGEVKKRPRFARQGAMVTVRIMVCCEPFAETPQLGRLTLRDEGRTIAIGKVLRVLSPT